MADGESGELFEEIIALVRYVVTGEKEAIDSAKKVQRATQASFEGFEKETLKIYKGMEGGLEKMVATWRAAPPPIQDATTALREFGMTNAQMVPVLKDVGYKTKDINQTLGESESAWDRVSKSIKWAVYRFFTTLVVYQALRQLIRRVNESIQEAIRLYREWGQAVSKLSGALQLNRQLVSGFVGDQEEWLGIVDELAKRYGLFSTDVAGIAQRLLMMNAVVGMSEEELKALVEMMANLSKQFSPDMVEAFADAIDGQYRKIQEMGIAINDDLIEGWINAGKAAEDYVKFTDLTEQQKQTIRLAFLIQALGEVQKDYANDVVDSAQEAADALDTIYKEQQKEAGRTAIVFTVIGNALKVFWSDLLDFVGQAAIGLMQRVIESIAFLDQFKNALLEGKAVVEAIETAWVGSIVAGAKWRAMFEKDTDAIQDVDKAALKLDPDLQDLVDRILSLDFAAEGAASSLEDLADAFLSTFMGIKHGGADLYQDYLDDLEDLDKDYLKNKEKLNKRYDDRAEDLRKRALDRIQDLQENAAEREENDRADLNLHLKHMEEDHLLDMKHLREDYEMDFEEAAHKRDWVTMRRLQRQYGKEKRQREEDYQLNRKQYIESWEQRHKVDKEELDKEIKEIQDSLAEELAELEAERAEELQELKDSWQERRDEARDEYQERLADLQQSNAEQLAEIIARFARENEISTAEARDITGILAHELGLRETDVWNHVQEINDAYEWLKTQLGIAVGDINSILSQIIPAFGPGYEKIPQLEFAKGGTAIATKPTLVKVGEAGPELFTAIPLAKGGSVLGGIRNSMNSNVHLTIDGNQSGLWGPEFENGVLSVVKDVFQEAFEE